MSYIGKEPADSFISFAKQDFSTSATTSYTLDNAVTNENELALFINFVRQEPTTAYTASGTTLTLTSATASGDDMYCVYLGQAKQTVNAPDGSVGNSQVVASIITGQTALASEPDDTDEFLVSDAGVLKRLDYSLIKASGIEEIDMWRITSSYTSDNVSEITSNWERADTVGFSVEGTGMSESSGIFSFPSTGYWQINSSGHIFANGGARTYMGFGLRVTEDNSSYTTRITTYGDAAGNNYYASPNFSYILRVSNITNVKVKMFMESASGQDISANGDTNNQGTGLLFIKLRGL